MEGAAEKLDGRNFRLGLLMCRNKRSLALNRGGEAIPRQVGDRLPDSQDGRAVIFGQFLRGGQLLAGLQGAAADAVAQLLVNLSVLDGFGNGRHERALHELLCYYVNMIYYESIARDCQEESAKKNGKSYSGN